VTAPKAAVRGRPVWFRFVWIGVIVILVVVAAAIASRAYLNSAAGQSFLERYPGESAVPSGTPGGFPWWAQVLHSLNFLFILLLIRSGWMVHSQRRPEAYWTRNNTGWLKTKKPPTKMSLYLWLHLTVDVLWLLNGVIFGVMLFVSGHWGRVVPTHWDVFPNAWSAALQYASFDWPVNEPWLNYNAIQVLAYFFIIFIAAPLAAVTGIRMSPVWRSEWKISKLYPVTLARAIHLPVMVVIAAFVVVHVILVFSTGILVNLNVMYANTGQGSGSWWGLIVFLGVMIVAAAAWVAARPMFLQPVASMTGRITSR
jgi:thiosulfate reductase cytochrome b subunit